jgi:flagellar motor switch protein FliN/FliY
MSLPKEIHHLIDVPIDIEVELGQKTMTVEEILALTPGSVIKLPRSAGENIDILAGSHLFGSGEMVVIDQRFGARITDFREEE